ncbi:MAG: winged helix-turn-helix transcriptional regulator [Sphingomonadales bacterium]|nr:winged helix-turn-helix transcriptional regulator [Sphingomonadales bacterium]MDE2170540.1 winged helix-turn-helix transcriptional regulator [Sphingomonadales bacterium]
MHPLPPSLCVCTTLRRATRALTRAYDEALADHGITIQQFAILRHTRDYLRAEGSPIPLARLAQRLVMDRTSLYRALPALERAGWLALASPSPRLRIAAITPAGEALIMRAEPDWTALQTRILASMQPGEWLALQASADRLASSLSQDLPA